MLALLRLISEVPVANFGPQAGYPSRDTRASILWFASVAASV